MADQQAGWYPDPSGDASKLRYWDGMQWTGNFSDAQPQASFAQPEQSYQQAYQQPQQTQAVINETPYTNTYNPTQVNPAYVQTPAASTTNGQAIAALICGIVGLCIGFVSVVAIILGINARKNPVQRGMATAGLVLGIIGAVGWIIAVLINFVF